MSFPPWLSERQERRDRNTRSRKQEEERASEIGGKRQPGSGSSRRAPGDVISDTYLEQLKFTDRKTFVVRRDIFGSDVATANTHGKQHRLIIEFSDGYRLAITEA